MSPEDHNPELIAVVEAQRETIIALLKEQQAQITTLVVAITMQQGNIAQLIHGQGLLTQSIGALLGEEMGQPVSPEHASDTGHEIELPTRSSDSLDPDDD